MKRFPRRQAPPARPATLRLEVAPGDEGQVDFGFAGEVLDPAVGRLRRAWVFVLTLAFSRHQYAEAAFAQSLETADRAPGPGPAGPAARRPRPAPGTAVTAVPIAATGGRPDMVVGAQRGHQLLLEDGFDGATDAVA